MLSSMKFRLGQIGRTRRRWYRNIIHVLKILETCVVEILKRCAISCTSNPKRNLMSTRNNSCSGDIDLGLPHLVWDSEVMGAVFEPWYTRCSQAGER